MRRVLFGAFLLATFALPAQAIKLHGQKIIIPIVGRFAGAYGTQWRTDLFIRMPSSNPAPLPVTMTLYVQGGSPQESTFTINQYSTVTFRDVVKSRFCLESGAGQLQITSDGYLEARARIFNTGNPAGEFGQGVEGIAIGFLQNQAIVYGLDGTGGNRVNAGVANPNDVAVDVVMLIKDAQDNPLAQDVITLQPYETRQINNVFAVYGIPPQEGVTVAFAKGFTATPIYGYASEVRNDTGDAIFTFGTSPNS